MYGPGFPVMGEVTKYGGPAFPMGTARRVVQRPWSASEDAALRGVFGRYPAEEVARRLGRTLHSVKNRALRLGLCLRGTVPMEWTDDEVDRLMMLWSHHSAPEIGRRLGRSEDSVNRKTLLLGLRKLNSQAWTQDAIDLIASEGAKFTDRELAKRLGRTARTVRYKRLQLGVEKAPEAATYKHLPTPELRELAYLNTKLKRAIARKEQT